MSAVSSVRPPHSSGEVPLLNHGFEVSPEVARNLWMEGRKMPSPEDGSDVPAKHRVLRSADGEWVIHRLNRLEADEAAVSAMHEFDQLQAYGVNVISRGLTPSPGREAVFAVTPYIPGLVVCTKELYYARLASKIGRYLDGPIHRGGRKLEDIDKPNQYSILPGVITEPFLRDPEPYLGVPRAS